MEDKARLVSAARELLMRRVRVGVSDGRVLIGKLQCLDKQGNVILYDTVELRQNGEQRSLGLVLVPSHCRTSIQVECSLPEHLSLLTI